MTAALALDRALDRVSDLDFAPPNPFVSHGPMACEALATLGFDAAIDGWVRAFEASMIRAVQPVEPSWPHDFEWKDALGTGRLLPDWIGYFERVIADDGWPSVVEVWVPRLMPGLVGALFHGVIRTAHAARAISGVDSPARRAELARALGHWATWYQRGQPVEGVKALDEPRRAAVEAAADGARCYAAAPSIFYLHGVTGAMAVELLAGYLSPGEGAAAVAQLEAEHRALYRDRPRPGATDAELLWDGTVATVASESYDPHQIKLVEACHRGFGFTGDGAFVEAAETVTGTRRS